MWTARKTAALNSLRFDPVPHTYTLNGGSLMGVTSVLQYIARLEGIDPKVLLDAQTRGKLVHWGTERMDYGDANIDLTAFDDAGLMPYLKAWDAFKRECKPSFESIEKRLLHLRFSLAGTADRIGYLDGKKTVFDIKTGEMYPSYGPQLAAYQEMYNEDLDVPLGNPVVQRIGVQLKPNGKYSVKKYENPLDWQAFVAALTLTHWSRSKG